MELLVSGRVEQPDEERPAQLGRGGTVELELGLRLGPGPFRGLPRLPGRHPRPA